MKESIANLRILIVIRSLQMGGAERQVVYLSKFLKEKDGVIIKVLSFFNDGPIKKHLQSFGIPVIVYSPGHNKNKIQRFLELIGFILKIRRFKPHVLMSYTDYPNKICGSLWNFTGAKSFIWNQRDEGREATGKYFERTAIKKTPNFVANSQVGKDFLIKKFKVCKNKIQIIHNSVNLASPFKTGNQWRNDLNIGKNKFLTVMVANIHSFKDHETLIMAWEFLINRLIKKNSIPILLLAGGFGSTYKKIKKMTDDLQVGQSVRFIGEIKDISGLLEAADLGVFSSKNEGCPNAVLEYMAAEKAVVATNIVGIREALGKDYPYLAPPDDWEKFARYVFQFYNNRELLIDWGERNQKRVKQLFSLDKMGKEYMALFKKIS